MSEATCKTCPFHNATTYQCRAHSPVPVQVQHRTEYGARYVATESVWPPVECNDWCGEHPDRKPRGGE